jgi:hypothetical protein
LRGLSIAFPTSKQAATSATTIKAPQKAWRLESRNHEDIALHTFPLPHLRNRTISIPRSEAICRRSRWSVTAAPWLSNRPAGGPSSVPSTCSRRNRSCQLTRPLQFVVPVL